MPKKDERKKSRAKRRVDLKIPYPALSTNKLFSGQKHRSHYYRKFRGKIFSWLEEESKDKYALTGNLRLVMIVGFSSSLSDLSNSVKAIEDILAEYFKFNDRQIVEMHLFKRLVHRGEEYMKISITKVNKNIDDRRKYDKKNK